MNINYYENEYIKIKVHHSKYNDKFVIDYKNNNIIVKRVDKSHGWGQNLIVSILDKIKNNEKIVEIGNSEENIKYYTYEILINNEEKIHYEDEKCKIYAISEEYNDIFKIDYDYKKIKIKRLDKDEGWGQILKLKIINEYERILNVGSSRKNNVEIEFNINKLENIVDNYYENDNYIVEIIDNHYNDIFNIKYYEENNTLYIKRIDKNEGWGQFLKISIQHKQTKDKNIIYIGNSKVNEVYKIIHFNKLKYYVSLTTIPSRIKLDDFYENVHDFIHNQTYDIEKFFVVLPKKYKRFKEEIPKDKIEKIEKINKVEIIYIDEDYGPASKYLGPLIYKYNEIENNILIIIDDDRKYNPNLVKHMYIAFHSYSNIKFATGYWKEYFSKNYNSMNINDLEINIYKEKNDHTFFYGNGLGGFYGFGIKVTNMKDFIDYHLKILERLPKSFYHDEGISLGYLKYKNENILLLKHKGCNYIKEELVDALCNGGFVNRELIEKQILQLTNIENIL